MLFINSKIHITCAIYHWAPDWLQGLQSIQPCKSNKGSESKQREGTQENNEKWRQDKEYA